MAEELPKDGRVMLRLGMTNPPYMLQHLDAVAEVWEGRAFVSFIYALINPWAHVYYNSIEIISTKCLIICASANVFSNILPHAYRS